MRVLLVSDQYSAEGGAEIILAGLARGLDERGHDVALCVARRTDDAPALPARLGCEIIAWSAESQAADPAAAELVAQAGMAFAPDVIHLHNVFDHGVVDALHERWPTVWTVHDHRAHCPNGDRRYPRTTGPCALPMGAACIVKALTHGCVAGPHLRTLRQLRLRERAFTSLAAADRIMASSRCVADLLRINGVKADRVVQVPLFTHYADTPQPPPYPRDGRVLFVGRLVPQKGVEDIRWLARRLGPNANGSRLVVAGDGPLRPDVEADAARSIIDYRGKLDRSELSRAYADAAVVVMTPRWLDPFGLVALEAMAHGRPLVAYRAGGVGELVESGVNGVAVAEGDRRALADSVQRLLSEPTQAAALGRKGFERARAGYRPRRFFAAIESVYNEALNRRGSAVPHKRTDVEVFKAQSDEARWQAALEVRLAVFVREQDVPPEMEVDQHDRGDETCLHALARAPGGRAAATGRIYEEEPGFGHIGRMAVLPAYRGYGVGMQILDALLAAGRERAMHEIVLDSQVHALAFYARRGFVPVGSVFDDCGIPHQRMRLQLV